MSFISRREDNIEEIARNLLRLSYSDLVNERHSFEYLLRNYDKLKDTELLFNVTEDKLKTIASAYRLAVRTKEREILKEAYQRGR